MAQPAIMIIPLDLAEDMSAILEAMGRGPNSFTWGRSLVPKGTTEVTHKLTQDMGADGSYSAQLRAMAEYRDLPPIDGSWGVNGVISASDAQYAMERFTVYTVANVPDANQWLNSILDSLNLEFEPDPEE